MCARAALKALQLDHGRAGCAQLHTGGQAGGAQVGEQGAHLAAVRVVSEEGHLRVVQHRKIAPRLPRRLRRRLVLERTPA